MHIPGDKLDGAGLIPEINITIKGSKVSAANVSTVPASCMVKKQTHLDKADTQRSASAAVLIKVRDTNCILIHKGGYIEISWGASACWVGAVLHACPRQELVQLETGVSSAATGGLDWEYGRNNGRTVTSGWPFDSPARPSTHTKQRLTSPVWLQT